MATSSLKRDLSPIAIPIDPRQDMPTGERDARLEDYLEDKFQVISDFDELDSIIADVELQKQQLDSQLKDARAKLAESKQASDIHATLLRQQRQEFEVQQQDVHARLLLVTSSDSVEEATVRLKGPMEKLRRVKLAKQYIELLKEVSDLSVDARRQLPENPKEALKPYTQLEELAVRLRKLQDPAEGAATHLVEHVENVAKQLWADMTQILEDEFKKILEMDNWPSESKEATREWSDCFQKMLDLQYPKMFAASEEPIVLLPMKVLVQPFDRQFRYNFSGEKPTAQPSKIGDYIFDWFIGTVKKWEPFLRTNIAPILAAHFRSTVLADRRLFLDPVSAFISALLPVLKERVLSAMDPISRNPGLLSKFFSQLFVFEEALVTTFEYDGGNPEYGWRGLSWDVLNNWFDKWLQVEKDFALQRYQDIIKSTDSSQIDYDSVAPGKTKPTFGAVQITDLLHSVTVKYSKLRRFSYKTRFLIEIQAESFDQYHGRLTDSLDVYSTIISTIGRTLHGVTKEQVEALDGVGGLESLCKVYGSSEWVIKTLKEWANDTFFVELWEDLQERAKRTSVEENLAGSISYTVVKDSTSNAVGSNKDGGMWDVTLDEWTKLQNRAGELIISALRYSYPKLLKHYIHKAHWSTIGTEDDSTPTTSPELDQPMLKIRQELDFLQNALGSSDCRRIFRKSFETLQDVLWNEVLMKQDFTTLGAKRFRQDVLQLEDMAHAYAAVPSTTFMMPKLLEGSKLLNLPLKNESGPSLREVSRAFFGSSEEADKVMDDFKFTVLKKADARQVMQRRREAVDY